VTARFLCDRNLGKLIKWLRILGYDTLARPEKEDLQFFAVSDLEERIVLTCRVHPDGTRGRWIVVKPGSVEKQLRQILEILDLHPDRQDRMTICLRCNTTLHPIEREEAECAVPAYVYRHYERFRKCPFCGRIYWPGTHVNHVHEFLRNCIPTHHP